MEAATLRLIWISFCLHILLFFFLFQSAGGYLFHQTTKRHFTKAKRLKGREPLYYIPVRVLQPFDEIYTFMMMMMKGKGKKESCMLDLVHDLLLIQLERSFTTEKTSYSYFID